MITFKMIWAIIILGYCFVFKELLLWIIGEIQASFRKPLPPLGEMLQERKLK